MADINNYINQILQAVYGKEVRSSIADALAIINEDNNKYQEIKSEILSYKNTIDENVNKIAETLSQSKEVEDVLSGELDKADSVTMLLNTLIEEAKKINAELEDNISDSNNHINQLLEGKEDKNNRIDEINFPSTNFYPSAKAVWDYVSNKQEEINALISTIPKFSIVVAEALPTEDISSTAVYLISSGNEEPNLYTEYIYVNDKWEKLGEQSVDLTGYVKNTDYAGQYEAGVIKADGRYALWVDPDGFLRCTYTSVEAYAERDPGSFLSKGMLENLKEKSISETSTDVQIPTAKAVYDLFSTEKSYVDNSLNEKQNKLKAGTGVEILADGTINCTFEDYSEVRF